jgi:hypothetical protein
LGDGFGLVDRGPDPLQFFVLKKIRSKPFENKMTTKPFIQSSPEYLKKCARDRES